MERKGINMKNKNQKKEYKTIKAGIGIYAGLLLCLAFSWPSAVRAANSVGVRVDIDRGILPAGSPQKAIIKITLDPPPAPKKSDRPAVNLALVLDRSGSMAGEKLERAKEAAIAALRSLSGDDIFSLVIYDHNVETIVPAQSARNVEWIEARIRQIYAGGNTALFGGVSQGASEVRKHLNRGYVNRIILLSDGQANVGPSSPDDLGRLGISLLKEDISVSTVGVGMDYNEDLMTRLSQNSDGNSYFVESSRDLTNIFTAELGDVLNVVARQVRVIIECPDNVRPITIIGREGRILGHNVELYLNQLYGGKQKYALVEVEVAGGKEGESRDLAYAHISYENSISKKNETVTGKAVAQFSRDQNAVNRSANSAVVKEYQLNMTVKAQEDAIALSDKGQNEEAAKTLQGSAAKLKDYGLKNNDSAMIQKATEMEKKAEEIQTEGMTNKQRKVLRTDSYQIKNQQSAPTSKDE
jgi:Ca-activated chloride channel homolog